MKPSHAALLASVALLVPLAGECSAPPTEDRQAPNGTRADSYGDATHVTVYRNADQVPNIATFCLGPYGWATTLKTGSSNGGDTSPALVRFTELDRTCAG